jgi:hypothetical protein
VKSRFITYEIDQDTGQQSVSDIVEISDADNVKATRRRMMRQLGFIVDKMLDGTYGFDVLRLEREK